MMRNFSPELEFALRLAAAAEREIRDCFPPDVVEWKADGTVVTAADRRAEAAMRALIEQHYPGHGILGEEHGERAGSESMQWVLDPIDGTSSFALGIAKFGTLIGLLADGQPRLGVIHLPLTSETLLAERGGGCWYLREDGEAERVRLESRAIPIEEATISITGVDNSDIRPGRRTPGYPLTRLMREARRVSFVGDCIQHMLVARGRLHAALDTLMSPWDSAALVPCILEAGGVVSTADGVTGNATFGGSLLTSCHPALHDSILRVLNGG